MNPSKILLLAELAVLFVIVPFIFYMELFNLPRIPSLLIAALYSVYILHKDRKFNLRESLKFKFNLRDLKFILIRLIIIAPTLVLTAYFLNGGEFFFLPRNKFWLWLGLLILYPPLSALPQEFLYRVFFFHRYRSIFKIEASRIAASSILFAGLHIIYDNYIAIVFTLAGGLLFSLTYSRVKSLWIVTIEHGIYGILVFTVGLGRYFYDKI